MSVVFEDHSEEILAAMEDAVQKALEECGLTAENYAKRLCPVDTGNLRNGIAHSVSENVAYVGTNIEYGKYVELGTGKFVAGGRPAPWVYQDAKGNWHRTHGQKAQPFIKPAVADHVNTYQAIIEKNMKHG